MRAFKRTLSVLLCCVLLAALAPMAYAGDTLIEKAYAFYTVPAGGEPFDFNAVNVPDGAQYTARISSVNYVDAQTQKPTPVKSGELAVAGVTYYVYVAFEANGGYTFDDAKTEYYVNEVKGESVASAMVRATFTAQGEAPAEPEPSKPTFRDRVAQFFRDMRNRFLFVIYFIRYLFGIKT